MAIALKRTTTKKLEREEINLPDSSIDNLNDVVIFKSYVASDMLIECIRALKRRNLVS